MIERWICMDTETSGLVGPILRKLTLQPHIIEFSAVQFSVDPTGGGEETGVLDFLCNPGVAIAPLITKITGLSGADVQGKPGFHHYADQVRAFMADADTLTGHNLSFDDAMLGLEFQRLGQDWTTARQRRVCSVESSEWLYGRRVTLSELHECCTGTKHVGAHRALADVRATIACVRALRRDGVL